VNTNSTDRNERHAVAGGPNRTARKPYVKPEVRHERVFETRALTCGKVQTTQSGCHMQRKTS